MKLIGLASGTEFTIPDFYFSQWGSATQWRGLASPQAVSPLPVLAGVHDCSQRLALTSHRPSDSLTGQRWPLRPASWHPVVLAQAHLKRGGAPTEELPGAPLYPTVPIRL